MDNKTISRMLEEIGEEFCDKYCKYPEEFLKNYDDPDEAHEVMIEDWCPNCPVQRLV